VDLKKKVGLLALACIVAGVFVFVNTGMVMQVSWIGYYANITQMYQESDIVIRGVITESTRIQSDCTPKTVHQVTVLESFKGNDTLTSIPVGQLGAYFWIWKAAEASDFPLYYAGEEVILFLDAGSSFYQSLGGPLGSFKVVDGKVCSIGRGVPDALLDKNGTDVTEFIEYLRSLN